MMKFATATNNAHKLTEMRAILAPLRIKLLSLSDVRFFGDIEETGSTFHENALIKARAVQRATGLTAIADDSGICVDALDGAPGVYSARYGGDEYASDGARTALLLDNMKDISERSAYFVSVIAVVFDDGREITAEGRVYGTLTHAPRGEGGFGYDPIFELEDGRTMAEIPSYVKNRISHRANALRKLEETLKGMI